MELFLDDPNENVDSSERNFAKRIHLIGFIGSVLPPLNFVVPFILSKSKATKSKFIQRNTSNVLNLQSSVLILYIIAILLYLFIDIFYVLLFLLFVILLQCIYSYNNYDAAKNGYDYKLPFMSIFF